MERAIVPKVAMFSSTLALQAVVGLFYVNIIE